MKKIGFTHICRIMSRIRITRFLRKGITIFLCYKESYTFYLHCTIPQIQSPEGGTLHRGQRGTLHPQYRGQKGDTTPSIHSPEGYITPPIQGSEGGHYTSKTGVRGRHYNHNTVVRGGYYNPNTGSEGRHYDCNIGIRRGTLHLQYKGKKRDTTPQIQV